MAARVGSLAKTAYSDLTVSGILQKLFLLRVCGTSRFVKSTHKLHHASVTLLGDRVTAWVLRNLMVKHFVAGENYGQYLAVAKMLSGQNVKIMMLPSMEDISDSFSSETVTWCKHNKDKFLSQEEVILGLDRDLGTTNATALKLSAILPTFAANAYSTACHKGGVSTEDAGCMIAEHFANGSRAPLDLVAAGDERKALELGLALSKDIFEVSAERGVPVLIDAETKSAHTAMFAVYLGACIHRPRARFYVTYQCYMKDMLQRVHENLETCKKFNIPFGAKVVRGAYLQIERDLAKAAGLPDPTWPSAADTSKCYNEIIGTMLDEIGNGSNCNVVVATHNQESVDLAKQKMKTLGLVSDHPKIWFGQSYGMCDHISYSLGHSGYNVFKSTPYGKADEWIPYLVRRAAENHTAVATARNESPFYWAELRRRLTFSKS